MVMNKIAVMMIAAAASIVITGASAQTGPVAEACNDDMAKYCADKSHGSGEMRACLDENIDKVKEACKTALETTGGGQGQGLGQRKQ
jgi:hypothetical protein